MMSGRPLPESATHAIAPLAQRRAALATTIGLLVVAVAAVPFGGRRIGEVDALLPAVGSATLVAMLVSSVMLRNQYGSTRHAPLAVLGIAYSTTALLLIPYMLAFPHVFTTNGFGTGPQTAPWLWVTWHAAFVMLLGGYVWSESFFSRKSIDTLEAAEFLRRYTLIVTVLAATAVATILCLHADLPPLLVAGQYTQVYHVLVEQLLLASACIVMATLIARNALRHTTDLWLLVVLAAFAIEICLNADVVNARFTVAWYMGFFEATVWQGLFLFVQLQHLNDQLAAFAADARTLVEETKRDALTGLFNRRGFEDRYELALADCRAANASIALLVLDLDHFKAYNDHFGHLAGDDALRAVAGAMSTVVNRPADACCRIGGEEFAIILALTDEHGAVTVAERVRIAVLRLRLRHAPQIELPGMTVSVGIAVANPTSPSAVKTLHERADQSLYRAKALGRNRVVANADGRDSGLRVV